MRGVSGFVSMTGQVADASGVSAGIVVSVVVGVQSGIIVGSTGMQSTMVPSSSVIVPVLSSVSVFAVLVRS